MRLRCTRLIKKVIDIPNWCKNQLTVVGPPLEIFKFSMEAVRCNNEGKRSLLSLDNFVPMPKELENTESPAIKKDNNLIEKYGADNWFDWRVIFWGTKWDISEVTTVPNVMHLNPRHPPEKVVYDFDTAWSPPEPAFIEIAKKFPKLIFKLKYWEPGMAFRGILIVKGEKIKKQATYSYMGG